MSAPPLTVGPAAVQVVKYGVLSLQTLQDDLLTWRHLYIGAHPARAMRSLPLVCGSG